MKYSWQIFAALSGLFVAWELLRKHSQSNPLPTVSPFTADDLIRLGLVPVVTPSYYNPTGAFATGLSQYPYDPNIVQGT